MVSSRFRNAVVSLSLLAGTFVLPGCGAEQVGPRAAASPAFVARATVEANGTSTNRPGFLGAFFRAEGSPPFGIFEPQSTAVAPVPYPTPGTIMTGPAGYCDRVVANGASIDGSYVVDPTKLSDIIYLGVRWTRLDADQFFVDESHIFGPGNYAFGTLDAAQCVSLIYHNITPVINLSAGPVEYDATPGTFSPRSYATYQTAADFGQWCGVVAAHERAVFPAVSKFSIPGNEVDTNPQLFPGGEAQIAAYSEACYTAIKAANPSSYIYGFELNMDGQAGATQFVKDEVGLGCGPGTCYDGISLHLTLRYPIPPPTTPCYPNPGGNYDMQCVSDIETAASGPIHVLISESMYGIPSFVPDEHTKALAVVAEMTAYAANPSIDGVSYANVDECALYPSGAFTNACLIDTSEVQLPAYGALQWFASQHLL